MKPFWSIFKLNFIRTMNTWMVKFLFAVCMIGIAGSCFFLNNAEEAKAKRVSIQGESSFFTKDFISQLEQNGYQVIDGNTEAWDIGVEMQEKNSQESVIFHYKEVEDRDLILEQLFESKYVRNLIDKYDEKSLQIKDVYETENHEDVFLVFVVTTIIIYLFIIVCGGAITSSVAMERIAKVSELLVYRISTLKIIYAKILALFASIITIIITALIEILLIKVTGFMPSQIEQLLQLFQGIRVESIIFLISDACLGIYLYTLIYTMVGMTITEAEQLQYAQLPATIVLFIAYGVGFYSCFSPDSIVSQIAFFIPVFTPFVAPSVILGQSVTGTLLGLSAVINIVFIITCNLVIMIYFVPYKNGHLKLRKVGI